MRNKKIRDTYTLTRIVQDSLICLLTLSLCAPPCLAQDTPVVLEYIPAGQILTVEGVQYMAYDLPAFKEVALVDAELAELHRKYRLLEEQLNLKEDAISILTVSNEKLLLELDRRLEPVILEPDCQEPGFWNPTHITIEVVLLGIIGGMIYALAD